MALPLILAGVSLGAQGYSAYEKNKAQKEADAYQRRIEAEQKKQARKEALMRAIGSTLNTKPYEYETSPDLSKYFRNAGIADVIGNATSMAAGELRAAELAKGGK